ncbi:hypothetical protein BJY04DRAFT_179699 [Aspergillus karnatakaensis]|uniref:SDR family oxidoreductase n=1 Tax=Aspergillus karnatakaensis TaxID=1810916 RepID=UPI003CCCE5D6
MSPSILIAGATGNTGRSLTETLPTLLKNSTTLSNHRVIALTRSLSNPVAQQLAKIPGVEVIEQNWIDITADWLLENSVERAFIASNVSQTQFTEESSFHVAALRAGVKYVVRISTVEPNVRPDCDAYYPRTHWAIETMLSTPEFSALQWTSLQPNAFTQFMLATSAELIKQYRKTGKQETLRLMSAKDAPVGVIDPYDVGILAAYLLVSDDVSKHNKARYVVNGPEDVAGRDIVGMVENYIGTKVEKVVFKDMSIVESFVAPNQLGKNIILTIKHAMDRAWEGKQSVSTTSKEVLEISAPRRTPADVLKTMLEE